VDRETKVLYVIAAVGLLIVTNDAARQSGPITAGLWGGALVAFSTPFWRAPLHRPVGWKLPFVVSVATVAATVWDFGFRALRHTMGF
jgi:hypothetical protein